MIPRFSLVRLTASSREPWERLKSLKTLLITRWKCYIRKAQWDSVRLLLKSVTWKYSKIAAKIFPNSSCVLSLWNSISLQGGAPSVGSAPFGTYWCSSSLWCSCQIRSITSWLWCQSASILVQLFRLPAKSKHEIQKQSINLMHALFRQIVRLKLRSLLKLIKFWSLL